MQLRRTLALLSLLALFSPSRAARAGDVWASKPFTEWSDKEVQKILTSSPWGRPIPLQLKNTEARDAGAYKAGVPADDRFGAGKDTQFNKTTLTVVWTGRTVRSAIVRQRHLKGGTPDEAKDKEFIDGIDKDFYVLVLQAPKVRELATISASDLAAASKLVVGDAKSGRVIGASRAEIPADGGGTYAVFYFPRGEKPIAASDKEVTFATKIGDYDITRGFDLGDMMVGDALDL
ncbi:MAG: hypothetical protein U0166_23705 [Acidobacteriota bacterium]